MGQGGHPATKSRPAVFFPPLQAADGMVEALWRSPRNLIIPGWEMQTQARVRGAWTQNCPKLCRAHADWVAAKYRKPNYLENAASAFGRITLSLFLFIVHRLFLFLFFCRALELGGIPEFASRRFISQTGDLNSRGRGVSFFFSSFFLAALLGL